MIKQCVTRIRVDIQRTTQSQSFVNNKRHQISHDAEACVNERRISNGMVQRVAFGLAPSCSIFNTVRNVAALDELTRETAQIDREGERYISVKETMFLAWYRDETVERRIDKFYRFKIMSL